MTLQDGLALGVCALALAWLLRRLLVAHAPSASRPDVTRAALLKRTRERRAAPPPSGDGCKRC